MMQTTAQTKKSNYKLKVATFPYGLSDLCKINRVQAVDDVDKLCIFHENLTTNADCIG